jgi:BirA family biotin operon repressor/biotin-[acetyl-CoA-carboxylase] ligase
MQSGKGSETLTTKDAVLALLEQNRGRYVSGPELAEKLSLSRTAVWKAMQSLGADGFEITAVKNKGYRLENDHDRLSAAGIAACLPEPYQYNTVVFFGTTDSTNTQARRLALDGAAHGTVVAAAEQTAGRGRSGKSFFSPDSGLYLSIILKPPPGMADPQKITIAAAVAVCRAIEAQTALSPKIKWVNDVYLDGKKVCGILTEAVTDLESGGIDSIVVGVGVNCAIPAESIPPELVGIVGSLNATGLSRSRLAADITSGVLDAFDDLSAPALIAEYRRRSFLYGKEICFQRNGETLTGTVTGIGDDGNLLVQLDGGESLSLSSGEVSISRL